MFFCVFVCVGLGGRGACWRRVSVCLRVLKIIWDIFFSALDIFSASERMCCAIANCFFVGVGLVILCVCVWLCECEGGFACLCVCLQVHMRASFLDECYTFSPYFFLFLSFALTDILCATITLVHKV